MWGKTKAKLSYWFRDSEILGLARVQMFVGAAGAVAASMDWTSLFMFGTPTWQQLVWFGFTFAHGAFMEYLRRRRATDL